MTLTDKLSTIKGKYHKCMIENVTMLLTGLLTTKTTNLYKKTYTVMTATYQLSVEELTSDFFKKLKKNYPKGNLTVMVDTIDETEFLRQNPRNREVLLKSIAQVEAGNLIAVNFDNLVQNP